MPTFGALLKKKKTHSTGSKDTPASPTVAEASSTLPSENPELNRPAGRESSDKAGSAVNANTNTSNNNNSHSIKGTSPDTQMNPAASTNQQSAQGANSSSHHNSHHHHLPHIGSIKSIINPTHGHHGTTQGNADANYAQTSQVQGSKSQARQTKGKYSLEDFSLQRTLGTGSFGRVHLVQSRHNHRFYAIKVLKKAQVVKMKQVEHTNDERRMLQRVKHPFLITLWGTFQDSKNLYMVMDFVEGGELFSLLRKSQRFPNPVAKFYAAEVTLALEYLHSQHIIYRDLKPENLLLDRHGHLKITDFGFAKEVPDITWTLCGTPDYLAPEVVSSKGYNKSVDWWSLGILIFEMLCGFTPFWDSGSPVKIYENILRGKIKFPPYMHPDAVDLLSQLITPDLTKRLGNLHGGPEDVKTHPWFAEVTWDRLLRKDIDAPYVPPVRAGQGDASQFDKYPEESEAYGAQGEDPYYNLFTEF
ncbi:cAMP-dependent protein kinase type 2 [Talaromyces atroroseus]|uniref:cAMP-dependent protein kinase n=1 Tax=Talaromyces atroroseus TaxID=1441469 RepID=A0A225B5K0_TALAT|nr:cAMP-dependent protein kinase type 2 [Talaromyces atroroseus]OKL62145.1 cAMP-dependent protein kinase type 2 [Talaromyces atroroseus]